MKRKNQLFSTYDINIKKTETKHVGFEEKKNN